MTEISKSDWKKYREKISDWQEHYMERLIEEYITFLRSGQLASDKFWELEKRIKQDKKFCQESRYQCKYYGKAFV